MPTNNSRRRACAPMLLLLLLSGCAASSPPSRPVPPPQIPPLPAQARQQDWPTHSQAARAHMEQWLQLLTDQSSPGAPARPPMTR